MSYRANLQRVDVFSLKGGVGKTTISILLGRELAERGPVLIIDADLTGTCVGDLLAPLVTWPIQLNLAHLICGPPERLVERLTVDQLPVYAESPSGDLARLAGTTSKDLLFCPSHSNSADVGGIAVERRVIQALLAHENAGGWVSYVIDQVIAATDAQLKHTLAGVIVDHSPSISALQHSLTEHLLKETERVRQERSPMTHRAVVVTTPDVVDLKMAAQFANLNKIGKNQAWHWLVNKTSTGWRQASTFKSTERWFKKPIEITADAELEANYRNARRFAVSATNRGPLQELFKRIFPAALP